ncbi:MAG: four helix bundle protein [Flavobacteriia bacterium]|jgi:four helix bundle protein
MQKNKTHEDLIAWQKGHQLTLDIFRTVNDVDPILFEFMKESALRIVSKIAEGISKFDLTTKLKDLEDAKGASARLSSQIILSGQLNYISKESSEQLYAQALEVSKIITGLMKYIRKSEKVNL